ncbi:MAG: ABC transporter ATP-binding protein [Dehalococcoidia bacterium]
MRYLLRLLPYLRPYTRRVFLTWLCVFASGAFVMVSPVLVRQAINQGLRPVREGNAIVGLDGNEQLLIFAALAVVAFAVARGLTAFGQTYLGETVGQHVAYDIRNEIYNNIQRLSYAYHDQVETGQIMSRATQDVENIRMFFGMSLFRLGYVAVLVVVAVAGMFVINPTLALVSIVTVPLIAWRSIVMSRRMRPVWQEIQQSQAEMTQTAEESLTGIRVVKAFSREPFESEKFRRTVQQQADLNYHQAREMAKHQPLMQGLSMLQIAITVGFGSLLIARGQLQEGDLLAFVLWLNLLQLPIRTVGFLLNGVARCVSSAERVFELIDAQSAVIESPDAVELASVAGAVRFEDVSFGYDQLSPVLSGINIDAQPGQVIALLGPAGSGKSTVVNLIPRFYDVTAGRITIDGQDIRGLTIESLRRNIGIVQQDVFLFIGTIRDNIAYGRPDASQEDIERAAKAARIHDFIVSLPLGYQEWVGERGVTLSGGQKQRIAIARTLLLDPRILIFDDSTASVDAQTEYLILQALQELMVGRTTFVIAQRLRTVMRADEIVVLDRGRIVQRGTHTALLAQEGLYRTIFDLELKDQEEALGEYLATHRNGTGGNGASEVAPAPRPASEVAG